MLEVNIANCGSVLPSMHPLFSFSTPNASTSAKSTPARWGGEHRTVWGTSRALATADLGGQYRLSVLNARESWSGGQSVHGSELIAANAADELAVTSFM